MTLLCLISIFPSDGTTWNKNFKTDNSKSNNFEGALDNYDKAIEFFEGANNSKGVEKALELIEECYNLKAEYLRSAKKTKPSAPAQEKVEEEQSGEEKLKEEKGNHPD